ncbi:MAG: VOC family protein [Nocardioidaceae bacterium]
MTSPVDWMHVFVDVPTEVGAETRAFWSGVSGWPVGSAVPGHPEFRSLDAQEGSDYVHIQEVGGPPRVHVDLVVEDLDAGRMAMLELGAQPGPRHEHWQVMTSPHGQPFCLCREPGPTTRPPALRWPSGHRSRLVQVCLDVPDQVYDAELAFWQSATGWRPRSSVRRPEFTHLLPGPACPVQLLVQRLGPDDGATRAHLDLGTDDVAAEVDRLVALGAVHRHDGDGWVVLEDVAGLPFCVTRQPC